MLLTVQKIYTELQEIAFLFNFVYFTKFKKRQVQKSGPL